MHVQFLPSQPFQSWLFTAANIVYLKRQFGRSEVLWQIHFLSKKMKIIKVIPAAQFLDKIIVPLLQTNI